MPKAHSDSMLLLPVPAGPVFFDVTIRMKPSSPHGLPHELRTSQYSSPVEAALPQPTTEMLPAPHPGQHQSAWEPEFR